MVHTKRPVTSGKQNSPDSSPRLLVLLQQLKVLVNRVASKVICDSNRSFSIVDWGIFQLCEINQMQCESRLGVKC